MELCRCTLLGSLADIGSAPKLQTLPVYLFTLTTSSHLTSLTTPHSLLSSSSSSSSYLFPLILYNIHYIFFQLNFLFIQISFSFLPRNTIMAKARPISTLLLVIATFVFAAYVIQGHIFPSAFKSIHL